MPGIDIPNMKVADLKRELKVRGLSTTGNKNELQERLQAVVEGEPLLEESAISGEDLLDEDAVLSDEEETKILNEHELLKSPLNEPTTIDSIKNNIDTKDRSLVEDELLQLPSATTSKKIVLKRKNSITCLSTTAADTNKAQIVNLNTTKENTEPADSNKKLKMSERNPITLNKHTANNKDVENKNIKKLSELSVQERLEMRAKKFGIEISATALDDKSSPSSGSIDNDTKQLEVLKKRAERFGCVTSTNLAKVDAQERLLKRKQRFGGDASGSIGGETSSAASPNDWAEKARKRLVRFKTDSSNATVATPAATVVIN